MHWVDVCGPPGSGKSTLCDSLWDHRAITWDGKLPPAAWHDFLNEITRLFHLVRNHSSFVAAIRMNRRSVRKMATVSRLQPHDGKEPYIQTGLVQRGLGFGWRLNDMGVSLDEIRPYFRLMPVSIGVAVATAPIDVVIERNRQRPVENRDFQVPLMAPAIDIALEILHERGVPVARIDTTVDPAAARGELVSFAGQEPFDPAAAGPDCEVEVLSPPVWW